MDAATTPTTPSQDALLLIYCTHRFPPTLFGDYRLDPNLLNAPFLKYGTHRRVNNPRSRKEKIVPRLLRARRAEDAEEERKVRKLASSRHAPGDWIFRARTISCSWQ